MKKTPALQIDQGLMIAWKKECYRSSATARTLGIPLHFFPGANEIVAFKILAYFRNMIKTLRLLWREQPRHVVCLNLPPFLPLSCFIYTVFFDSKMILDFHSGVFTQWQWKPFQPIYRYWVRHAPFTLCHNRQDGAEIVKWGGRPVHFLSLPIDEFPGISYQPREGRPLIFVSCSFAKDEPIDAALNAMKICPEADFLISGNYRKYGLDPARMPHNVSLAGFMEYRDYLEVMAKAAAVLTLSNCKHIMQMTVHEALTIGTPVVTNDSPAIMEVLGDGGVYVKENESNAIASGLKYAIENQTKLASAIVTAKSNYLVRLADELEAARSLCPDLFLSTSP